MWVPLRRVYAPLRNGNGRAAAFLPARRVLWRPETAASLGTRMDRRRFLQVIGTTSAAAGVAGCSSGGQKLIPYLIPVEELTPGVSSEFATVCRECPAGCGMIARVRDGRAY